MSGQLTANRNPTVETGSLVVDLEAETVAVDGRRIHLTRKEYELLKVLCLNMGRTLPRHEILDHLYGWLRAPDDKILDVFMNRLRAKLGPRPSGESYVSTIRGQGFALCAPI